MTTAEDPTVHHAMSWCSQLDTHIARVDERLADVEAWMEQALALERVQRDAVVGGSYSGNDLLDAIARAETAERKLADLNAQAPEAYAASVRTVRTLTTERDAARAALRDLRSTVQLARDDLDIAQAGSEATPFARHDLLTYVATAYDRLAAALASATPAEGGERGPFVSGDEAQRFCGYCHDPVVGFLAVGHDCQHNGGHPVSGVTCPRAKSAMTPCIARDGRLALDDVTMECVGCSAQPKALMDDLAKRYPPAKAHLSSNNSLTLADRFRDRVAEYIATPAEGGDQS